MTELLPLIATFLLILHPSDERAYDNCNESYCDCDNAEDWTAIFWFASALFSSFEFEVLSLLDSMLLPLLCWYLALFLLLGLSS